MTRRGCRLAWVACLTAGITGACTSEPSGGSVDGRRDVGTGTHVVLLGTGTPNAEPDRSGTAIAVLSDGKAYLVDAGPGVVRRAAAAVGRGMAPLRLPELDIVFLTHLHSDHTVGLPDLLLTPWVLGRDRPLRIMGPPGTTLLAEHIVAAYTEDIAVRTGGLEPANDIGHRVEVTEIDSGLVFEDNRVRVIAFPVRHATWPRAFGFRFETPDRTVVISGDTSPSENIITHCAGCDILLHEVYSAESFSRRAPQWRRYHAAAHTSSVELAELAHDARPEILVLYHQLLWGTSPDELLDEVRSRWSGNVVYGRDLDVF